jgi:hypothetical protein
MNAFGVLEFTLDASPLLPNMTYAYVWSYGFFANHTQMDMSTWFLDDSVPKTRANSFRVFALG